MSTNYLSLSPRQDDGSKGEIDWLAMP